MRKKIIFISIITLILATLGILPATASTNGPHGNYGADTDACSACHETHQSDNANLTNLGADVYEICLYCHSGMGSIYDVYNGVINGDDGNVYRPNAGGDQATLDPAAEGGTDGDLVNMTSSRHDFDGFLTESAGPGGAGNAGLSEIGRDFTCISCHNPHGSTSDRLLVTSRTTVEQDGPDPGTDPDIFVINVGQTFQITINNARNNEAVTYLSGTNAFCSLCHYDFDTTGKNNPGEVASGKYTQKYRHAVGVDPASVNPPAYNPGHGLPLEQGKLTCLSCHYSHSTDAGAAGAFSGGQSALLRLNDRGVCWACHRW